MGLAASRGSGCPDPLLPAEALLPLLPAGLVVLLLLNASGCANMPVMIKGLLPSSVSEPHQCLLPSREARLAGVTAQQLGAALCLIQEMLP